MASERLGPVTSKRAAGLEALADGRRVDRDHRKAEEQSWNAMPGLPILYRVGVKLVRTPFTEFVTAWEISARARAKFIRSLDR